MPSLLPPNATTLERALAQLMAEMLDIPTPIGTLWKSYWPESVKRARVRQAIDIARRKGTAQAVRDVVTAFGGLVTVREWWQTEPKGPPGTFELVLTLSGHDGTEASAQYVDDVIAEIRRTKPARAHFTFTQGFQAIGACGVIAVARPLAYARLQFAEVA